MAREKNINPAEIVVGSLPLEYPELARAYIKRKSPDDYELIMKALDIAS